ncbi:AzlC family ABC transporter permease [Streptomyces sp. L7]
MVFILYSMRSIWRTPGREVLRDVALVCLAVGVIGLSYGAIAVASGFPLWAPVLLGVLVVAASSEFLFIGIIAAGGSPIAAVLAGLLVNARHLPFGLAIPEVVGRAAGVGSSDTHLMNDARPLSLPWRRRTSPPSAPRTGFADSGSWCAGRSVLSLGGMAGSVIKDTDALGLDAMFPAVILALILPSLRDRKTRTAAFAGSALALIATPFLPAGAARPAGLGWHPPGDRACTRG